MSFMRGAEKSGVVTLKRDEAEQSQLKLRTEMTSIQTENGNDVNSNRERK